MKKFLHILLIALAVVSAAVSLAFGFIEGRILLSGDWLLHEQPAVGMLQYLLRFTAAAYAFLLSVRLTRCGICELTCTVISCAVMAVLVPNGFGILFLLLSSASLCVRLMTSPAGFCKNS